MLLCPRCQFENPDPNKFCQQCGNSLIYKPCHECGTQVPVSAALCQNCGVATGQVWRAVIYGRSNFPVVQLDQSTIPSAEITQKTDNFSATASAQNPPKPIKDAIKTEITADSQQADAAECSSPEIDIVVGVGAIAPESFQTDQKISTTAPEREITPSDNNFTTAPQPEARQEPTDSPDDASPQSPEIPVSNAEYLISSQPAGAYLDSQQRYQLLETLPARKPSDTVAVTVLDCQPLQMSPLKAMLAAKGASVAQRTSPYRAITDGEDSTNSALAELCQGIAEPYLALRWQFSHNLPVIHDSWSDNEQAVLLLEDCSQWPLLVERWSQPETSTQQILYWLHEMTELWAALEPWRCRQSLLELTNLRVNPDSSFSLASLRLERLYPEPDGSNLQLVDLGQLWQVIFNHSDRTQFGALLELLQQMYRGEISTIEELRSRLETVPLELQPAPPPTLTPTRFQNHIPDNSPPEVVGEVLTQPMPVQIYCLEDAGLTDVGRTRDHNEDFFSIWTQINKLETSFGRIFQTKGLYILCDGMGGHDSGEVASQLAAETLRDFFQTSWQNQLPQADTIREGVLLANKAIFEINQKDGRSGSARMGTTLVVVLVQDTKFAVAHVGDSRLYRLRKGQTLEKITSDHEVGQREIKRGVDAETAYSRPDAYQLTQALGPRDGNFLKPDVQFLDLCEDTLLILASDGLTDNDLLETHWRNTLEPLFNPQANLDQGVAELIELANKRNGHDNITAIIIRAQVGPFRF
ncbi:serine/threonine phosphatase [Microcoleus sp. A2-C5]|uniref:serine/threonine phosphatase n=1 Tax=unclassified Microcoleus TaxID=2642155 RepID=UPI002FD07167